MDLVSAIGLISSFVTLEEAGRSWILIIKDKIKRKEIDINNWDSDDPLVQVCLDRFKTDMGDKYKDHIFSEEEIQDIIRGFFEQNRELRIGNEEKKLLLYDDFSCWDEGCYMGQVSKGVIDQMRKCN